MKIFSKNKIKNLEEELDLLKKELAFYKTWVPPGHFYSPIPSIKDILENEEKFFDRKIDTSLININEKKQIELLTKFSKYYLEIPFKDSKTDGLLYFFNNSAFSYADAISLYSMIRIFKPKKFIEVGSGYSSCVTLDTNRLFLLGQMDLTFIEPYPELLKSLTSESKDTFKIIDKNLQDVPLETFERLRENDILFIDSTHVSKIGSDVNYIFFEILPVLKSGVIIHFHDIFYPFEYPKSWIYEGRAWNELYLLRAFLLYNNNFEILFFNDFIYKKNIDKIEKMLPNFIKKPGSSIWLRKK